MPLTVQNYIPSKLRSRPTFVETAAAFQQIVDDAETAIMDSHEKYYDFNTLPISLLEETIAEYGYDYIIDVLTLDEFAVRQITFFLGFIQLLKGHKDGLLTVLDLLGFRGSTTEEWWEQSPVGVPETFDLTLNLTSSIFPEDSLPKLIFFIRQYVFPLMTTITLVEDALTLDFYGFGISKRTHYGHAHLSVNPDYGANFYTEELIEAATISGSFQSRLTLTETFVSAQDYIVIVNWKQRAKDSVVIQVDTQVDFDGDIKSHSEWRARNIDDYISCSAVFRITGDNTLKTIDLQFRSSDGTAEVSIRDPSILALAVSSATEYSEPSAFETDSTIGSVSYQSIQNINHDFASADNLFLASLDISCVSASEDIFVRLNIDGSPIVQEARFRISDPASRRNVFLAWIVNPTSSPADVDLEIHSGSGLNLTVRNAVLVAIPLTDLVDPNFSVDETGNSKTEGWFTGGKDGMINRWQATPHLNNEIYYWISSFRVSSAFGLDRKVLGRMHLQGKEQFFFHKEKIESTVTSSLPISQSFSGDPGGNFRSDKFQYGGSESISAKNFLDGMMIAFQLST